MSYSIFSLEECKIRASILLKNLNSTKLELFTSAFERFKNISFLQSLLQDELIKSVKLKHALDVIALENGFMSWVNLKFYFTDTKNTEFLMGGGFLHKWFSTYKEAKSNFTAINEFLLPYKKNFFIANTSYIDYIGLDITNPDWQLIGNNWVEPLNKLAWKRLSQINLQQTIGVK